MQLYPPTIIVRHKRENLKKCSLRGLESREDMHFFTYPGHIIPSLKGFVILSLDGPPLSNEEKNLGLVVIDGTWRYAAVMEKQLLGGDQTFIRRSIPPGYMTAYPRRQLDCSEPGKGLASVEALYIAYHLMGRDTNGLLDHYYWRDDFLELNRSLFLQGYS